MRKKRERERRKREILNLNTCRGYELVSVMGQKKRERRKERLPVLDTDIAERISLMLSVVDTN
tara:strand:+ start:3229 stop:3417 length:189 start_codon:yes stop_codon:yes gene_type:complete